MYYHCVASAASVAGAMNGVCSAAGPSPCAQDTLEIRRIHEGGWSRLHQRTHGLLGGLLHLHTACQYTDCQLHHAPKTILHDWVTGDGGGGGGGGGGGVGSVTLTKTLGSTFNDISK